MTKPSFKTAKVSRLKTEQKLFMINVCLSVLANVFYDYHAIKIALCIARLTIVWEDEQTSTGDYVEKRAFAM